MPRPAFRLGSTSYVYPGDLLHNITRLAGQVQDVELVLFDLDGGPSNLPSPAEVRQMAELAAAHDLTYTVHLPLDLRYSRAERHPALVKAEQVMTLTAPLPPYAYLFHLDGTGVEAPGWVEQALTAVQQVLPWALTPTQLTLENLESYSLEYLEPIFAALPIARALDIGHLWKAGCDPLPVLDAWLPYTRIIHLHGVAERDHCSLQVMPPAQLDPIVARLIDWPGVLTLEVFEDDFFSSCAALSAVLERISCR